MKSKTGRSILVIFPRGEAVSNFVSDDFIKNLKAGFSEVHFLSVETDRLGMYSADADQVDSVHLLRRFKRRYIPKYINSFLDLVHNLKIKTVSSQDRIRFRRAQATKGWERFKLTTNIAVAKLFANKTGISFLEWLNEWLNKNFDRFDEIEAMLDQVNPDFAFNTSHIHNEISYPYMYALKRRKVQIATFIFSWDNITSQGRIFPRYDHIMTWNKETKGLIEKYYGNDYAGKICITGTPQFDHYFKTYHKPDLSRKEFCDLYSFDPDRPLVLYSSGMPHHMPGEPVMVKRILEVFEKNYEEHERPQLILRVYPKDDTDRFEPLRGMKNLVFQDPLWDQRLRLPSVEAKYLLKQTMMNVDLGINIASTIALELLMFDKKVLNIGFTPNYQQMDKVEQDVANLEKSMYSERKRKLASFKDNSKWYSYDHYVDVTKSECCIICFDENQLEADLIRVFDYEYSSERKGQLLEKKFQNTLDGNSINRITNFLRNTTVRA